MLVIGNVKIDNPVILAPMSGVTDLPFRKLVKKFGVGLVVTEMIASRAMIAQSKKSLQKSQIDDDTSVQIAGCEADVMQEAAKMIEQMGAKIIDINFGCPAKKIVNNYSGSFLMRDEKLAAELIRATVKAVNIPVTLKMRMGWDHNNLNAPKIAQIAEQEGVKMITVHGRTRCQFYSGKSDWKFIKSVKEAVNIPVIANGDIRTPKDAKLCLEISNADGVMVGRGCYGKPWLPRQIIDYLIHNKTTPTPNLAEQLNIIIEHFYKILEYYGVEAGVKISRKHLSWYTAGLPNSAAFRAKINTSTDVNDIIKRINAFYEESYNASINCSF